MTTTITAAIIQAEFNTEVAAATIEYIIDSSIDMVNADASVAISAMSGTAGSKTVSMTGAQAAAVKACIAMKLASRVTAGSSSTSTTLGPFSTSTSSSSGGSDINLVLYKRAIQRLREVALFNFRRA